MDSTSSVIDASSAQPSRELITTATQYRHALASLIGSARSVIRIFDADGAQLDLNTTDRTEALSAFLRSYDEAKLIIVVRSTEHLEKRCPRFVALASIHGDQIGVHQADGEALRVEDCFMIVDSAHFARRTVQSQPRGVVTRNDERETQPMIERFQQIVDTSKMVSLTTTLGL